MAVTDVTPNGAGGDDDQAPRVALLNNPEIRGWIFQIVLAILIVYLVYAGWSNMNANLQAAGIASGWAFLGNNAGFAISQSLIEYSQASSSYGRVYVIGLLNTLIIAFFGIIFATIIGFLMGVARLSKNWLVSRLATVYVEALRNIPLLLQIFIWYFGVLRLLPQPRQGFDFGFLGLLNNRGYFAPKPVWGDGAEFTLYAFIIACIAAWALGRWARARQMATGQTFPAFWTGFGMIVFLPLAVFVITGSPLSWDIPVMGGFRPSGGMTVIPEFIAMLVALAMYTAAFIAEIVRAGILAVSRGQTEAANALGLRSGPTLRLVVIPQALRIIIPPLTSQYLNLTKNSSLAVAIAYPELTSVFAGTALNQTGQAVEIISLTMLTYLTISLLTSLFMNWYNSRVALVER
ncbi:amino acid ABC transporter permease [Oricola cellulosilytica]|uniref:Amino acid ABC transporter permease n=1 Tax=Oricola cellulosilytica TaxID=1429082 RepID=A0A4R0PE04_9HYPH|nr:amino acid ABC transporter permease [Oricola cellulosilytica]TCD14569.1 amino acid ABC transporter permease [Oricola cellulosilytica]